MNCHHLCLDILTKLFPVDPSKQTNQNKGVITSHFIDDNAITKDKLNSDIIKSNGGLQQSSDGSIMIANNGINTTHIAQQTIELSHLCVNFLAKLFAQEAQSLIEGKHIKDNIISEDKLTPSLRQKITNGLMGPGQQASRSNRRTRSSRRK